MAQDDETRVTDEQIESLLAMIPERLEMATMEACLHRGEEGLARETALAQLDLIGKQSQWEASRGPGFDQLDRELDLRRHAREAVVVAAHRVLALHHRVNGVLGRR